MLKRTDILAEPGAGNGIDEAISFAIRKCSLGSILVAGSTRGICAIFLGDHPKDLVRELKKRFSRSCLAEGDAVFDQLVSKVVAFVEAPGHGLDLLLDVRGTAFQKRVWQALQEVPAGKTASYKEIAERIGSPKASRAVARACADNRIAIAIPCHRVVHSDGSLSGYRWGVERKRTLLDRESKG